MLELLRAARALLDRELHSQIIQEFNGSCEPCRRRFLAWGKDDEVIDIANAPTIALVHCAVEFSQNNVPKERRQGVALCNTHILNREINGLLFKKRQITQFDRDRLAKKFLELGMIHSSSDDCCYVVL